MLGELIEVISKDRLYEAGYHEVEFNGLNISSGVYIYRLETQSFVVSKKMILMK